ncbi:MAG: DUF58 domain-containing protein [Deltaproteobacteria bacterium]|nr:DUF58 domain-containing protein [Deltaproteobacteria bacterium]
MRPTRLAVIAFAAGGVLAILTATLQPALWTFWLAFVALSMLALGADAAFAPRLGRMRVEFSAPEQLMVGVEHDASLRISAASRRARLRVHLDLSEELELAAAGEFLCLEGGQGCLPIVLRALRRGRVQVAAAWLQVRGPLGLVALTRRVSIDRELPVMPDLGSVSRRALRFFSSRSLQHGSRVERHQGDGSEFESLREYQPGFDIRSIDWKASARMAHLLCREMRAERNRQIILAIDSGRLMSEPIAQGIRAGQGAELSRLDHAIHAALTLATVSLQVGDRVGLLSFDDQVRQACPPLRGRAAFGSLSQMASRIEYSSHETNFTLGLMGLAQRQLRRALVVVMTDFVDTIAAELLVENLGRLSRRHLLLFVALRDPMLEVESEREPSGMLDLNRAVVAHRLLQEREMVIRKLRRKGILCIDAPPVHVSTQLIDHYLQVKRREAF